MGNKMKKLILFSILLLANSSVWAEGNTKTLIFTKTISQLAIEKNKHVIQVSDMGSINITYPETHKYFSKNIQFIDKSNNFNNQIFEEINLNWNTTGLIKRTSYEKAKMATVFYSSDTNPIELKLLENGVKIWSITIENLEEMKFYNKSSKKNSPLFSLIENIEKISTRYIASKNKENIK